MSARVVKLAVISDFVSILLLSLFEILTFALDLSELFCCPA